MKYGFFLILVLFCSSCRPVHETKLYYDEYINPKASIDYDASVSTELPQNFLDNYYSVDSKLVRLVHQLELADSVISDSWMSGFRSENVWIKAAASWDKDLFFISGDDVLGYDPTSRKIIADLSDGADSFMIVEDERLFLLHVTRVDKNPTGISLVEINAANLLEGVEQHGLSLAIDGAPILSSTISGSDALAKAAASTRYSGQSRQDNQTLYWVRSMAASNFMYLHLQ